MHLGGVWYIRSVSYELNPGKDWGAGQRAITPPSVACTRR